MTTVYLNGEFLPQQEAKISVMDRGFLFADGVYEVFPVFSGNIFGLQGHLDRLDRSLAGIQMTAPLSQQEFTAIFHELLTRTGNPQGDFMLYLQITRGVEEKRQHDIPLHPTPTVLAFCQAVKKKNYAENDAGYSAITLEDSRRRDCWIKAISLLVNVLLYDQVKKANAVEAILIRDGKALEGTSSNLFMVKNNVLITPPLSKNLLAGVTRQLVMEIAQHEKIEVQERDIPEMMIFDADEVWMTGSLKEICPITSVNGKPIGTGRIGPVWRRINSAYEIIKNGAKAHD